MAGILVIWFIAFTNYSSPREDTTAILIETSDVEHVKIGKTWWEIAWLFVSGMLKSIATAWGGYRLIIRGSRCLIDFLSRSSFARNMVENETMLFATTQNKTLVFKKIPTALPVVGEHLVVEDRPIDGDAPENAMRSYFPAFELDDPVTNSTICKVLESNAFNFAEGDLVCTYTHIAEYAYVPSSLLELSHKIQNPHSLDLGLFLGPLGMPGLTAWSGLYKIGRPKKGETIFVSSAAGAVGQPVGQIAKREGLTVIGSVGSDEKVDFVTKDLGFDAGFNYKNERPKDALPRLAPDGVDIYFENVGGDHLEAALPSMNTDERIAICGMISNYNIPADQQQGIKGLMELVSKSITMEGFLNTNPKFGPAYFAEHQEKLQKWIADGSVKAKLAVTEDIENASDGLIGMLVGKNFGKAVLKVR
ncbi:NAD(P)-binding protein [Colletotrichum zoysiae]|uniref:Dehydrogenase FUB6 n=1 Tax=Colletotrichum zoysiae TaxID=1216348 RepID=A0AAD9HP77_9PEZI|nr:NAD(P)-binding protein [Colletotrichum zoysiae]